MIVVIITDVERGVCPVDETGQEVEHGQREDDRHPSPDRPQDNSLGTVCVCIKPSWQNLVNFASLINYYSISIYYR